MGDFYLDLLRYNRDAPTQEDSLFSQSFLSLVYRPMGLTSYPVTLIGHFRVPLAPVSFDIGMIFYSCKKISFSQERLCTWPLFESESFWNSEVAH